MFQFAFDIAKADFVIPDIQSAILLFHQKLGLKILARSDSIVVFRLNRHTVLQCWPFNSEIDLSQKGRILELHTTEADYREILKVLLSDSGSLIIDSSDLKTSNSSKINHMMTVVTSVRSRLVITDLNPNIGWKRPINSSIDDTANISDK